jgi:hypothetical protein
MRSLPALPFAQLPFNVRSSTSAALPLQSVVRPSSRRAGEPPCNQIHFQTVKFCAVHIAASSNFAQQAVSAAAVTCLLRRCMLACRQVHFHLTVLNFRPSLLPSALALRFGISEKNGNLAKGNSPLPWVRYAPIYQRLSVAFWFRPSRRSNAPHQRSASTSPICFAGFASRYARPLQTPQPRPRPCVRYPLCKQKIQWRAIREWSPPKGV